ncbi:MAG: hypothetical protein SGJ18_08060 [Pseudomonadota bacterium]|nr:hypothetical protein [Pseudomonadota bacterium]
MKILKSLSLIFTFVFSLSTWGQVCPGSDEVEAKVSHIYNGKAKVFVCGFEEIGAKSPKGKRQLSDFTVYSEVFEQKPAKIFSVGALDNFWVGNEAKNGIVFEELIWVGGRLQPFLKSGVGCTNAGCERSQAVCVLQRPKSKTPDIVRQIDKKLRSKFTRIQLPLSDMVELTFVEALAGIPSAIAFFDNSEWANKLEPNAAQTFMASKKSLERVNLASCWQKSHKKR